MDDEQMVSPVAQIWKELAIALKLVVWPKPQSPVLGAM